jgi:hypothetical protein
MVILPVVSLVGGCGEDRAGPVGDPRPRVEGTWRVVMTSRSGREAPGRATWTTTPTCRYGACDFTFRRSSGKPRRLRLDKVIGDYTGAWSAFTSCTNLATGEVIAARGYKVDHKVTLRVTRHVRHQGRTYASELVGEQFSRPIIRPEFEGPCREEFPATFDLRMVRSDPPPGTPTRVAPAGF